MVKLIFLCRRRPDITHDRYAALLLGGHVPIALRHHPTMQRYTVNIVEQSPVELDPLDSIGELSFATLADFRERIFLERVEVRLELEIAGRDLAHRRDAQRPAQPHTRLIGIELRERPVLGVRGEPEIVEVVRDLRHRGGLARHDALEPLDFGAQRRGIVTRGRRCLLCGTGRPGRRFGARSDPVSQRRHDYLRSRRRFSRPAGDRHAGAAGGVRD